jgi:D-serine deaminase-like pyridoxal phosphate-dependent protein
MFLPARPNELLADLETPALVLDLDAFEANLKAMARSLEGTGVALRPHAKTHKCAAIGRRQIAAGAIGLCVQKVEEAEALMHAGITDIRVTNEIVDPRKLARLCALAELGRISVCADSAEQLPLLDAAAREARIRLPVLVEIDAGSGRCGTRPGAPAAELAAAIEAAQHLTFEGIQAYHGAAQHRRLASERQAAVDGAVEACRQTLGALAARKIECNVVTGAGTGTYPLEAASDVYTEIQPGSYCVMDLDYGANLDAEGRRYDEGGSPFAQAIYVLATVISRPRSDLVVLDVGHKAVAIDRGLPAVAGRPDMTCTGASDEHLKFACTDPAAAPRIGDRLALIPGHCDPTIDRHAHFACVRGGIVRAVWPIEARGAFH